MVQHSTTRPDRLVRSQPEARFVSVLQHMLAADTRPKVILTDFDYTLCKDYEYDVTTNNHLPVVLPEVVEAAQDQHMIIATSRRANHPNLPRMWQSGLLPEDAPLIAENGGVLVLHNESGLDFIDLVSDDDIDELKLATLVSLDQIGSLPNGQKLIVKEGRTSMIVRLEDNDGVIDFQHQAWLASRLMDVISSDNIDIVDSRLSVTIQSKRVNKMTGFMLYLHLMNIKRDSVCVVGMGDAHNDKQIFDAADVKIGFSQAVRSMVDIIVERGVDDTALILEIIKKA